MFKIFLMLLVLIPHIELIPKQPLPCQKKIFILIPFKKRDFVPPEKVGVGKDCPFPTVKEPIVFECIVCGIKMFTHVLYPHYPHCTKCGGIMWEKEKDN
jgi:hypothetical protein